MSTYKFEVTTDTRTINGRSMVCATAIVVKDSGVSARASRLAPSEPTAVAYALTAVMAVEGK